MLYIQPVAGPLLINIAPGPTANPHFLTAQVGPTFADPAITVTSLWASYTACGFFNIRASVS